MNFHQITQQILLKQSYLCVGLDTDPAKLPKHLPPSPEGMLAFNQAIIQATYPYTVAYKLNTAFYEALGSEGWDVMKHTIQSIPDHILIIADAKRGDIGNTAAQYAKAFFETLPFHAITLSPYMGMDTIQPFLAYPDKWAIILVLTSNPGASDFQLWPSTDHALYQQVLQQIAEHTSHHQTMLVVGATRPEFLQDIRKRMPNHFLLVPGVGAQGGDLTAISLAGLNEHAGLLVNVSRQIIYASDQIDFAEKAQHQAIIIQQQMAECLKNSLPKK